MTTNNYLFTIILNLNAINGLITLHEPSINQRLHYNMKFDINFENQTYPYFTTDSSIN